MPIAAINRGGKGFSYYRSATTLTGLHNTLPCYLDIMLLVTSWDKPRYCNIRRASID